MADDGVIYTRKNTLLRLLILCAMATWSHGLPCLYASSCLLVTNTLTRINYEILLAISQARSTLVRTKKKDIFPFFEYNLEALMRKCITSC